ncbi:MAG: DUF177 domain-containing protein [Proteobacteria bacterium]|nr:DUF177 domain-containing protein [Pseudomonadota bacterium]
MSESQVPTYVDTRKIFLQQWEISGYVSLDRLPRFRQCLASGAGSVKVDLRFATNTSKQRLIVGALQAKVQINCQRCLQPLGIELSDEIRLALCQDEAVSENLDPALDPWICKDYKLDIASLVEEQLMLCLPIVSYHTSGDCLGRVNYVALGHAPSSHAQIAATKNPFSVLKSLKENELTD